LLFLDWEASRSRWSRNGRVAHVDVIFFSGLGQIGLDVPLLSIKPSSPTTYILMFTSKDSAGMYGAFDTAGLANGFAVVASIIKIANVQRARKTVLALAILYGVNTSSIDRANHTGTFMLGAKGVLSVVSAFSIDTSIIGATETIITRSVIIDDTIAVIVKSIANLFGCGR